MRGASSRKSLYDLQAIRFYLLDSRKRWVKDSTTPQIEEVIDRRAD